MVTDIQIIIYLIIINNVNKMLLTGGILALLAEQEVVLKVLALERLNQVVDQFWPEISNHVVTM